MDHCYSRYQGRQELIGACLHRMDPCCTHFAPGVEDIDLAEWFHSPVIRVLRVVFADWTTRGRCPELDPGVRYGSCAGSFLVRAGRTSCLKL